MNRLFLIFLMPLIVNVPRNQTPILQTKITMKVYAAEILESVILRLQSDIDHPIEFSTRMLSPYRAKAAEYKDATLETILKEQLAGTPLTYQIKKTKLTICLKDNGIANKKQTRYRSRQLDVPDL